VAVTLADKLAHQKTLKTLQSTRNEKRKDLFVAQDEVEARRDALIAGIEARLSMGQQSESIFLIRWRLL
jgi:adenine-specific DNA-methyltransferase